MKPDRISEFHQRPQVFSSLLFFFSAPKWGDSHFSNEKKKFSAKCFTTRHIKGNNYKYPYLGGGATREVCARGHKFTRHMKAAETCAVNIDEREFKGDIFKYTTWKRTKVN